MISLLSIDSVAAHHAGQYTCIATNIAGSAIRSANLTINGIFIDERVARVFFIVYAVNKGLNLEKKKIGV